jgi:uncharacterized protein YdaU (DUF1376 family)
MGSAFLFYVDDWLSSSRIDIMTGDEERGYLRLLLHAWKQPDCGLPNDDDLLAGWSKLGKKWRKSSARIRACFFENNGRLYNERLLAEWNNQREFHEKRGAVAKAGAKARWSKKHASSNAGSMPEAMPKHCLGNAGDDADGMLRQCLDDASPSPSISSRASAALGEVPPDRAWLDFREQGETYGWQCSEIEWNDAKRWGWDSLPFPNRLAAVTGIRARLAAGDQSLVNVLPKNYLTKAMWQRRVSAPRKEPEDNGSVPMWTGYDKP